MQTRSTTFWLCTAPLAILFIAHACADADSEPYFNNDETRHVMTGVFVRDGLADRPTGDPKGYAVRYYLQYPALGLMVWPPLFYGVEGAWMFLFGTSFLAARLLIAAFGILAGVYFFRLVCRTHDRVTALFALLIFGFSPLVFTFSRQVMLELPALALALASIFHFERYLDGQRRRDAWLACLFAALAALTRFDGIFLLPFFLIRIGMVGKWGLMKRGSVIGGVLLALFLTAPYYYLTYKEYGSAISKAVKEGTGATSTSFFDLRNVLYYPSCIPEQVGWFATIAAVFGLLKVLGRNSRAALGPYLVLLAATYLTFTPMAELEVRHTIYWVPALAVLAVEGCALLTLAARRPEIVLSLAVACGTAWSAIREPSFYVFGYEDAARYVVANNKETRVCLMDGFLNGSFIYHVRRHDPERRLWVLRGDKVFYTVLSDPNAAYSEWVKKEQEILDLIQRYDPELIVVEEPQLYFELPAATLLRETLRNHPERFELEKKIPIRSNHFRFQDRRDAANTKDAQLEIWRNRVRNPQRGESIEIEMLSLGRSLGAEMKK